MRTVLAMRLAMCFAAATSTVGGLLPTPIGLGPRYHPPSRAATSQFACRPAPLQTGSRVHVELFAERRAVVVPAAIGLGRPRLRLGRVVAAACRGRLWTLDPSGVVRYVPGSTLGAFFAVWGQPLGMYRLASFRGRVAVYVNGIQHHGDPGMVRLRDGDEIVLEVGGHVPPHRVFRFPP
jgi:hypothetical protein